MAELKLPKLPDRTPVRLTISLAPELHALLGEYLAAYRMAYSEEGTSITDIIPAIVASFIENDRAFIRGRKAQSSKV